MQHQYTMLYTETYLIIKLYATSVFCVICLNLYVHCNISKTYYILSETSASLIIIIGTLRKLKSINVIPSLHVPVTN
jgi:tRNA(Arg) A34 adenosine deaminase TadA